MPEPDTRLCGLRETHDEPCPVPDLALDLDPPLVQLHNAMNLGQPLSLIHISKLSRRQEFWKLRADLIQDRLIRELRQRICRRKEPAVR